MTCVLLHTGLTTGWTRLKGNICPATEKTSLWAFENWSQKFSSTSGTGVICPWSWYYLDKHFASWIHFMPLLQQQAAGWAKQSKAWLCLDELAGWQWQTRATLVSPVLTMFIFLENFCSTRHTINSIQEGKCLWLLDKRYLQFLTCQRHSETRFDIFIKNCMLVEVFKVQLNKCHLEMGGTCVQSGKCCVLFVGKKWVGQM